MAKKNSSDKLIAKMKKAVANKKTSSEEKRVLAFLASVSLAKGKKR